MTAQRVQCTPVEKVRVLQRKLYRAAKAQPTRTFGVVYDKVCSKEVLDVAWNQVRRNRGAAGIDGETIDTIEACRFSKRRDPFLKNFSKPFPPLD